MPGRQRVNALVQPVPQSSAVLGQPAQFVRQQTGIRQTPVLTHPGSRTSCQNCVALKQLPEGPPVPSAADWFRAWREAAFIQHSYSIHTLADHLCLGKFSVPGQARLVSRLGSLAHRSRRCLMSPIRQCAGWAARSCRLCSLFLGTCHCPQLSQAQISCGADSSCANYDF